MGLETDQCGVVVMSVPAFPVIPPCDMEGASASGYPYPDSGMSLRDYMAVHSTQPGVSEIAAVAGVKYFNNRIWSDPQSSKTFEDWWECMPLEERLVLYAKVRYAQADAMLKVREQPT